MNKQDMANAKLEADKMMGIYGQGHQADMLAELIVLVEDTATCLRDGLNKENVKKLRELYKDLI